MNRKLMTLAGILALLSLSASYASAQAPEPGDMPGEHEGWQKEPPEIDDEGGMEVRKEVMVRKGPMMMQNRKFAGEGFRQGRKFAGEDEGMGEDKVYRTIKKHDPKFAEILAEARESAPAEYKLVINISRKMLNIAAKENDEKLEADMVRAISLEYDTKKLSRKYEGASDADKTAIKAELKTKLSELFDLRLKGQQYRVQRMEKELAKLKKDIETRKGSKDKIVQERVAQMTGEGFGW